MREVAFRPVVTQEMKDAAVRNLESGHYIRTDPYSDSEGKRFEEELSAFLETPDKRRPEVANLSSGTAAMHLAWIVEGIEPGDEVIIPANTFSSVADCVWLVGARPVTVDVEDDTYNMDPDAVASAVTSRTRAIMPVHTAGHPADMDRIMAIAQKHDLIVVEDACQGIAARHRERPVGTIGTSGCLSFIQNKAMTTGGEGGAFVSFDAAKVRRAFNLANHGRGADYHGDKANEGFLSAKIDEVGYVYRQSEILSAIGRVQLRLLPEWIEQRRAKAEQYRERLSALELDLGLPAERDYAYHSYVRFEIRAPQRDRLKSYLEERGIATKIHYPTPIHLDRPFEMHYGPQLGRHPVAERLAQEILSLPIYPQMSEEDVDYVAENISAFYAAKPQRV